MKFLRRLLRSFYPARCPYCGKVTTPFEEGCKNCVSQNPGQSEAFWIYHPYLGNDNIELICCSAWPYWDKPKAAVLRFKFHGRREYAESFGLSMARSVKENFSSAAFDLVCEIPLTKRRRRERGFDQARLLAKELARGLKLPYVSALEKPKGNRIQHGGGNSRHEICGAGAGGCDDDAGLSGGSGISVGRVGGALLVCRQNVIYTVTVVIELVINVDGLPAGITEHVGNALFEQHLNQYLSAVH